jgi:hypothetical protein
VQAQADPGKKSTGKYLIQIRITSIIISIDGDHYLRFLTVTCNVLSSCSLFTLLNLPPDITASKDGGNRTHDKKVMAI